MLMANSIEHVEILKTNTVLDKLLGGLPRGRMVEIYGDPSNGKSTLALQLVASVQQQGLTCAYADTEYSYDAQYAAALGVDNGSLGIVRSRFAEDVLDTIIETVEKSGRKFIVLDSVGGLAPRTETEKGVGEKVIGGQAGLVARFCRKVVPLLDENQATLVVINHSFVDIMTGAQHTSGGRKLSYAKSISIRLRQKNGPYRIMRGDTQIGKMIMATVMKDKVTGHEGAESVSSLLFGTGFSFEVDRFEEAIESGAVTKTGNTYWCGKIKLGVGKQKASESFHGIP